MGTRVAVREEVGVREGVGVRDGVTLGVPGPETSVARVAVTRVREGVIVDVGPGVRVGVCERSMTTSRGVAVREPGLRMMIGSVPLPAAVWIAEEDVLVWFAPSPEEMEPEEDPCWAVTTSPGAGEAGVPSGVSISNSPVADSAVEMPGSVPINWY